MAIEDTGPMPPVALRGDGGLADRHVQAGGAGAPDATEAPRGGNRHLSVWTSSDDRVLVELLESKACLAQMTARLGRSGEAIDKRLARLGLRRTERRRRSTTLKG